MISLPVFDADAGSQLETLDVAEEQLGGKVRMTLLREAVLMYEANQHIGTASTKTRSEVSGSNAKPHRQKGTGRARAGHKRSPLWRGGAVTHGPRPGSPKYQINRKQKRQALRSAILAKCQDGEVLLVDRLELPEIRTKDIVNVLDTLDLFDTVLIVTGSYDPVVWKSARNIPGVVVREVRNLNAYEVLVAANVLFTREAFGALLGQEKVVEEGPGPVEEEPSAPAGAEVVGEESPAGEQGGAVSAATEEPEEAPSVPEEEGSEEAPSVPDNEASEEAPN